MLIGACSLLSTVHAAESEFLPADLPPGGFGAGIDIGVRQAMFAWKSGDGGSVNPPFMSRWSGLRLVTVGLVLREDRDQPVAWRCGLEQGWIARGDNRHSGYQSDGTTEIYRSDNDGSGGGQQRLHIDAGPKLHPWASWTATPLIGFQMQRANLRQRDGVQVVPASGPYDGLDSTYEATWFGPRVGGEIAYRWDSGVTCNFEAAYGPVWYHSAADWNLRTDVQHPDSFSQSGRGDAWRVALAVDIPQRRWLSWTAGASYDGMRIRAGTDRINESDGSDMVTHLRGVHARDLSVTIGPRVWW